MKRKGRFTLKLLLSYLSLMVLVSITGYAIYHEVSVYFREESPEKADLRLVQIGGLITRIYEAESLIGSRLEPEEGDFSLYRQHVDSIRAEIQELKAGSRLPEEFIGLDSIQGLLGQQVQNTRRLLEIRSQQEQAELSIEDALAEFKKIQESLGRFQAENLFPGFENMSPQVQKSLREYAALLSRNAPQLNDENADPAYLDSILSVSRGLLEQARISQLQNQRFRRNQLARINENNQELSQQIRSILGSLEQEVRIQALAETLRRRETLRDTIRLAGGAALLGLIAVVVFAFFIHRDYYNIENLRRKLEKEKKYSESLLRSRERLIASVSHDLRSPLNTIQGYGELLAQTGLSGKQASYTASMNSASRYLERLANDLLDFSRLEAGQLKTESQPFVPSELIRETCQSIETAHRHTEVELELSLGEDLDATFLGDSFRLRQILSNLLGNAFKFTPDGRITVTASLEEKVGDRHMLQISVADTGVGIRPEQLDAIFREFTQADTGLESGQKGYGLGLTISRKLSELLGGSLTAESTWGEGSTFTLRIPIGKREEPEVPATRTEPAPEPEAGPVPGVVPQSVLVIDDDASLAEMIREFCDTLGVTCLLATGYEDLPQEASLAYDMVLSDIELPGTDGFEGLKRLKAGEFPHYTGQPVVAMSGRRDLDKRKATRAGFTDLLRKPFPIAELAGVLGRQCPDDGVAVTRAETATGTASPLATDGPATSTDGLSIRTDSLRSFLGPDPRALKRVLRTFSRSTSENLEGLKQACRHSDMAEMGRIAHQMLPMFRQLEIEPAVPLLAELENLADAGEPSTRNARYILQSLEPLLEEVLALLEDRLREHSAYSD